MSGTFASVDPVFANMFNLACSTILIALYHPWIRGDQFVSDVCQSEVNEIKRFRINTDKNGMILCGVSTTSIKTIDQTEHQGECLEICAQYPRCYSYNYHYDTTKCELFCVPTQFVILPNCFNYWVRFVKPFNAI